MNIEQLPSRKYILELLEARVDDPPTTIEIIQYVVQRDATCRDKVPMVLRKLEKDGLIKKLILPTKKGYAWALTRFYHTIIPKK